MGIAMPAGTQADTCEVCGSGISFFEAQNNKHRDLSICGSVECLNVLRQKQTMPNAAFTVYLKSYRQVIDQRSKRLEIQETLRRGEREQNQIIFARLKDHFGDSEQSPDHLVVIPTGRDQQVPLTQERMEKYRAHLEKLIAEAMGYSCVDDVPLDNNHDAYEKLLDQEQRFARQPRLKEVSDSFCILCKGGCCARGQEHAYLSVSHMRRLMDQDHDWTPDTLLQAYLTPLEETSTHNACINQGPAGCVLPRKLRSSTCNQFYCSTIKKYQSHITDDDNTGNVAVIQREQSLWNRSYSSEPNEVTSVTILTSNAITGVSLLTDGDVLAVDASIYSDSESAAADDRAP